MATDFGAALPVRNSTQTGEELKVVVTDAGGSNQAAVTAASALKTDGSAVTQPVSAASLPLPTGAATSANQTTVGSQTTKINDGTNTAAVTAASALKVDGSGVTQPVSGTVTANQGTAAATASAWPTKVTDGTNTAAVKAASTAAVAADPALVVAISPNNTLNVNVSSSNPVGGVTVHHETANTAASAVVFFEHVPAGFPFYLDSVWSTASGKHKLEVWTNDAAKATAAAIRTGGTQLLTGFGSASMPNVDKDFSGNAVVVASKSVYLIFTNNDNQSQSMYATIAGNS
jgi:hypothetical protein